MLQFPLNKKGIGLLGAIIGSALVGLAIVATLHIFDSSQQQRQISLQMEEADKVLTTIKSVLSNKVICANNFQNINIQDNSDWPLDNGNKQIQVNSTLGARSILKTGEPIGTTGMVTNNMMFENFVPFAPPGPSNLAAEGVGELVVDFEFKVKGRSKIYRESIPVNMVLKSGDPASPDYKVLDACYYGKESLPQCENDGDFVTYHRGMAVCSSDVGTFSLTSHYQRFEMPCRGNVGMPDNLTSLSLDPDVNSYSNHRNIFGENCATLTMRAAANNRPEYEPWRTPANAPLDNTVYGFNAAGSPTRFSGRKLIGTEMFQMSNFSRQVPVLEHQYTAKTDGRLNVNINLPFHIHVRSMHQQDRFGMENAVVALLYIRKAGGPWKIVTKADVINPMSVWSYDGSMPLEWETASNINPGLQCLGDLTPGPSQVVPCSYGGVAKVLGSEKVDKGSVYTIRVNIATVGHYLLYNSNNGQNNGDALIHLGSLKFGNYHATGFYELTETLGGQ